MAYNMEIYRGDIYYISSGSYVGSEQKSGRPGIIVSNDTSNKHSPNVEVVFLTSQEKKPLPTHVGVICKVPSTALCENIQTVSKERLGDFIKTCTDSEMERINEALMLSLGIAKPEIVEDFKAPVIQVNTEIETERNLYKALYEQLLDRLMVRG